MLVNKTHGGLKIYLAPDKSKKTVVFHLRGLAGSSCETYENIGAAHFTEHLVLTGTKNYPAQNRLSSLVVSNGGKFIATTSRDDVLFGVHVLKDSFSNALTFLSEIFSRAVFTQNAFETVKTNIKNEIRRHLDSPEKLIVRKSYEILFPNTRLGMLNTGGLEDIDKLSIDKIKAFYNKFYSLERFILLVYGNFSQEKIYGEICEKFKTQQKHDNYSDAVYKINPEFAVQIEKRHEIKQTYIKIDFEGESISSQDKILADLATKVLNLYLKNALPAISYKNSVDHVSMRNFGLISFYAVTEAKNTLKTVKIVKKLIKIIEAKNVSSLLEICKNSLVANIIFTLEKPSMYAGFYSEYLLHGNGQKTHTQIIKEIQKVTAEKLFEYINKLNNQKPKITLISNLIDEQQLSNTWLD